MTDEKKQMPNLAPVASASAETRVLSLFVQEEIGKRLRIAYMATAAEPLPERLLALLGELAKADSEKAGLDSGN